MFSRRKKPIDIGPASPFLLSTRLSQEGDRFGRNPEPSAPIS
jgi:hypothetical protein